MARPKEEVIPRAHGSFASAAAELLAGLPADRDGVLAVMVAARVADSSPRCIESIYGFDPLRPVT
jgi:hypothetical protein